ncbi:MAG: 16S rRNA processing protein RimM [Bacteroidetes bacterium]|nr:16S rRNA processing protein RimM [Bacteroidota bacterium]
MKSYFKLGKIVAAHGLKGELVLQHELGKKTDLKKLPALFLELKKDSFVPYFIRKAKGTTEKESLLLLEEIDTREKAQQLVGKLCWLPEEQFKQYADKQAPASLLGYQIVEEEGSIKILGTIEEVIEQPQQLLCRILLKGKEVLIPLNESTLLAIDHQAKTVSVQLPEGLIDIYLG